MSDEPRAKAEEAINLVAGMVHDNAVRKGCWPVQGPAPRLIASTDLILSKLALIHSEVSEALEEAREEHPSLEAFGEELADVVIRTMDLAVACGVDLGDTILSKMARNEARPHRHGKRA